MNVCTYVCVFVSVPRECMCVWWDKVSRGTPVDCTQFVLCLR